MGSEAKKFEGTGDFYAPQQDTKSGKSIEEQGELYAPPSDKREGNAASEPGIIGEASKDVRAALAMMKDVVVDKLSSLHLPAEAIEAGRKSMENLVKEVTHTYDNAKGAVIATKMKLVSSMSPAAKDAGQVAEEVDRSVLENAEGHVPETHHSKAYEREENKNKITSKL